MSHFLTVAYQDLEEYLGKLDNLIVMKKMMEAGMPVNEEWSISKSMLWELLRLLFGKENIQEIQHGVYIAVTLSEKAVTKVKEACKGKFDCEYAGDCIPIKVGPKGIIMEFDNSSFQVHSVFDDFMELAALLKEFTQEGGEPDVN